MLFCQYVDAMVVIIMLVTITTAVMGGLHTTTDSVKTAVHIAGYAHWTTHT